MFSALINKINQSIFTNNKKCVFFQTKQCKQYWLLLIVVMIKTHSSLQIFFPYFCFLSKWSIRKLKDMTKYMYFMVNITIFICKARHLVSISCISKHTHTEYYTQIINKCLHFCIISCFFTFGYKTEVELSCCIRYIHILKTVITLHAYNYVYNSGFFL